MIFPCLPKLHRLGKLDSLGKLPSLGKLDGLGKLHRRKFKLIHADQTDQSDKACLQKRLSDKEKPMTRPPLDEHSCS